MNTPTSRGFIINHHDCDCGSGPEIWFMEGIGPGTKWTEVHGIIDPDKPLDPYNVTAECNLIMSWRCHAHPEHTWEESIIDRTKTEGSQCPYCSGREVPEPDSGLPRISEYNERFLDLMG